MKTKIKSCIKIYLITAILALFCCLLYSFFLLRSNKEYSYLFEILIGGIIYLFIGLAYSNSIQKYGLWVGLLVGIFHLLIIKIIFFLSTKQFDLTVIKSLLYIICSTIGGILGISFKKIF